MEEFRQDLVDHIEEQELNERVFSKWQYKYDNMRDNTY
jgi:hypothetical protein